MTDSDDPFEKIKSNQTTAKDLDNADQLANFRSKFVIEDPSLIYLDGNSLGRLPKKNQRPCSRNSLRAMG